MQWCMLLLRQQPEQCKVNTGRRQVQVRIGVALVTYLIGAGIKKFQEQGEAGVSNELTQMHDMSVFCLMTQELLSKEK